RGGSGLRAGVHARDSERGARRTGGGADSRSVRHRTHPGGGSRRTTGDPVHRLVERTKTMGINISRRVASAAAAAAVSGLVLAGCATDDGGMESEETRSEEHTSELQSRFDPVCRRPLAKKNKH